MNKSKLIKTEHKKFYTDNINERFIQNSPTFCVVIDKGGQTLLMNETMLTALGYRAEEVIGKDYLKTIVPKHDQKSVREVFNRQRMNVYESTSSENYVLTKDGRLLYVEWHARPVLDQAGQYVYHLGVGIDITERKKIEEALKVSEKHLRQVSVQLMMAEERERNRISRELHDELGQALSILKLDIGSIMRKLPPECQVDLYQECKGMRAYIDKIIENVRRLARDLSPVIVDDLGLKIALRELLDSLSKFYKVKASISCDEINGLFTAETKIAIYRIFQEVLNNIVKHARASQISVTVDRRGDKVVFNIEDNGVGFAVHQNAGKVRRNLGLGLAAIHERVKMLGGSVEIYSEKGKGTRVKYVIPVIKEGSKIGNV